jgi:hypothetical protein
MKQPVLALVLSVAVAGPVLGAIATFDELSEGFHGEEFSSGGITFFDPVHFFGEPAPFVVENVAEVLPIFPGLEQHFSSPNVMGLAGYIDGPTGWLMGRIEQIKMTTGQVATAARMDVFYDDSGFFAGTGVLLEAMLEGEVVATDSFTVAGLDSKRPYWNELEISGVKFDALRLSAVGGLGGGDDNGFLGSLDNVEIVPAPGALLLGAIATAALYGRRRT